MRPLLSNDPLGKLRPLWLAREAASKRVERAKARLAIAKLSLTNANRRLNEEQARILREPRP